MVQAHTHFTYISGAPAVIVVFVILLSPSWEMTRWYL